MLVLKQVLRLSCKKKGQNISLPNPLQSKCKKRRQFNAAKNFLLYLFGIAEIFNSCIDEPGEHQIKLFATRNEDM